MYKIFIFIIVYYLLCFLFLNYIYFYKFKKYYKKIKYKEKETGKEIDIQDKYAYLVPKDNLNYFSFVIIGLLLFPIRFLLMNCALNFLKIHLKILKYLYKNHETNENQRLKFEKAVYFWLSIYFFSNNISTEKKEIKYETVYKKYLGEDYDFSQNNFSAYISNHISILDLPIFARDYGTTFLLNVESMRNPLIGALLEFGNFPVKLQSEESRKKALDFIVKRQNDFYHKKSCIKTLNFPEGHCTNGKYIINFKKGVFISLLPIKPLIILSPDEYPSYTNKAFYIFRIMTTFKIKIIYAELPVIKPTNYMFEKYQYLGKEKWEIFANVVNNIYSEVGGFKQISVSKKDFKLYNKIVEDGFNIDK